MLLAWSECCDEIYMLLAGSVCFDEICMLLAGSVCFWHGLYALTRSACFWQGLYAFGRVCMLWAGSVCFLGQVSPELRNHTHDMKVKACDTSLILVSKRICSIRLKTTRTTLQIRDVSKATVFFLRLDIC